MIIEDIQTRFAINKQEIIIGFNDSKHRIFDFNEIKNNFNLSVYELELIIGYEIVPYYYLKGQTTHFGTNVTFDNTVIKGFTLKEDFNKEEAKQKNVGNILSFNEIVEIKEIINKNNKHSILLKLANNYDCFIREKDFKAWTGLELKYLPVLVGLNCSPVYFKNGDIMSDFYGQANYCTKDNSIIKTINLRFDNIELESINKKIVEINSGILYNSNGTKTLINNVYEDDEDDDDSYGSSFEKYNGYNDWSDDVIDDAFEGDPDATWNVD